MDSGGGHLETDFLREALSRAQKNVPQRCSMKREKVDIGAFARDDSSRDNKFCSSKEHSQYV